MTTYGPQGMKDEEAFYGVDEEPIIDGTEGAHIVRRRHDSAGRLLDLSFYGIDDEPMVHSTGVFRIRQAFNKRGQLAVVEFFDENDEATEVGGESRREAVFDLQTGELREVRAYNRAGDRVR